MQQRYELTASDPGKSRRVQATFTAHASADAGRRRITGLIVPFGEIGHAAMNGEPTDLIIEAGGLSWDNPNNVKLVIDHGGSSPVFAGRARDLIETPEGIMATFSVAKTQAGDDLLVEASEGLRTGLSIEADIPAPLDIRDGVVHVTASNPAPLQKVAAVEYPAFTAAQVRNVAASEVAAAEVPDADLTSAIEALGEIASALNAALGASQTGVTPETPAAPAPAGAAAPPRHGIAATQVLSEAFPYGHPGAEGSSLFSDLFAGSPQGDRDSERAARADKAFAMLGGNPFAGRNLLTGANEPIVKSTVTVPNDYDLAHYVEQLKFERVIADATPGVSIDSSRPILTPSFTTFLADGGAGEPVTSATAEGSQPASAELAMAFKTSQPLRYSGLADISRMALDAGTPGLDAIIMGALMESYAQVTEAAASVAIIANGTAGTDVPTNADTEVEARAAQKYIRGRLAAFETRRGIAPDQVVFGSATYAAAVAADNLATGLPLYPWFSPQNQAGALTATAGFRLNVNGVEGRTGFKLTTDQFVIRKFSDSIRYESPTMTFNTGDGNLAPELVRFAVYGYMLVATLQAKGVEYFKQL